MGTTREELKRRALWDLKRADGEAIAAVEQAINDAHKFVARVRDFDELMVLDTTNALTVVDQKLYHLTSDLALVRPKDIYTIRYMDEGNSRKLRYVPASQLDDLIPYTELVGTGRPTYYTRRGMYIELYRIPDAAKPLYVFHSQWPDTLDEDTDQTPYLYIDDVLVTLATEIAFNMLNQGGASDWLLRAKELLGVSLKEEETRPDRILVAQPFNPYPYSPMGEYWLDPFVKKQP